MGVFLFPRQEFFKTMTAERPSLAELRSASLMRFGQEPISEQEHARFRKVISGTGYFTFAEPTAPNQDREITWPTIEQDFVLMDKVSDLIYASIEQDDATFRNDTIPQIEALIASYIETSESETLFSRLDDQNAIIGTNHKETPLKHSFSVLRGLSTDGTFQLPQQRVFARLFAMFHDLGKGATTNGDYYSDHAELSRAILNQYLQSRGFSLESAETFSKPVRQHHLMQLLEMRGRESALGPREVAKIVGELYQFVYIAVLTLADGSSSVNHQKFAVINSIASLHVLEQLVGDHDLPEDLSLFASQYATNIDVLLSKIPSDVLPPEESNQHREKLFTQLHQLHTYRE